MMQSLPKFTRVQFPQNVSLFHMLQFKLSMSGNEISCDCNLYEYIQEARPWLEQHWLEYTKMKCSGPLHLQQTQISQISKNDQIDSLVCNISRQDGCPSPCSCYTQPSRTNHLSYTPGLTNSATLQDQPSQLHSRINQLIYTPGPTIAATLQDQPSHLHSRTNHLNYTPGPTLSSTLQDQPSHLHSRTNHLIYTPGPTISATLQDKPSQLHYRTNHLNYTPGPTISTTLQDQPFNKCW
uniref:Uncharacterized protein LOC111133462 n=1 Tax=Crassostrea virginica TaxID=6565 RepID=A0A8B8ED62_CRAVI|nr:uncharacterized protein LOC111133462 [Crassostrea virginica]